VNNGTVLNFSCTILRHYVSIMSSFNLLMKIHRECSIAAVENWIGLFMFDPYLDSIRGLRNCITFTRIRHLHVDRMIRSINIFFPVRVCGMWVRAMFATFCWHVAPRLVNSYRHPSFAGNSFCVHIYMTVCTSICSSIFNFLKTRMRAICKYALAI